jgi:hypothetical protein
MWMLLDYECFVDKDDFTVVNVVVKEDTESDYRFLESTRSFISGIRESYPNQLAAQKQAAMDIPREMCVINNNIAHSYLEFMKNINYTKLADEAMLISTQESMAPMFLKLMDEHKGEHVADFDYNNLLTFNFWVVDTDHLKVEISKKFRTFKLDNDSNITDLNTLIVNLKLDLFSEEEDRGDVIFSVENFKYA